MSLSTEEFPYENTNYAAHEYAYGPFQNFLSTLRSTSVYSLTRGSDSDSSGGEASVNSTEELSSFEDFILEIIPDQTVRYGLTPFSIISSAPGRALFMCEGN